MSDIANTRAPSRASHTERTTRVIATTTTTGVRRTRGVPEHERDSGRRDVARSSTYSRKYGRDARESSFIEESSFVQNPLNSRLGPQPSADPVREQQAAASLKGVRLEIQEALILEDLLSVLMGIPGTYITLGPERDHLQGNTFNAPPHLDTSLRDMLDRILPLATYYTSIAAFIESRSHTDYGLVNHALCAAIRDMLKDYLTLVSQLEHAFVSSSTFTLQKLWFYVHPTLHTLSILHALTAELNEVENPPKDDDDDDSSEEEEDPEVAARKKALGLGNLKSVINDLLTPSSGLVKGGEVVTILWERMRNNSGDPTASEVYRNLLQRASLPYSRLLKQWTMTGHLKDPYEEVMVKESRSINKGMLEMDFIDEYWDKRYTLRDGSSVARSGQRPQAGIPAARTLTGKLPGGACIPPLLEGWKHKILLAGKYVNVMRECGVDMDNSPLSGSGDEEWQLDSERFYKGVEDAYTYANRTLLKLLIDDQELLPRLRAMKNYFFLSQSAFLTHFMELAGPELRKPAKVAPLVKLQSLLDLALNMNFSGDEDAYKYKEDVKVTLAPTGLYDWLFKIVSMGGTTGFGVDENGAGEPGDPAADRDKDKKISTIDVLQLDFQVPFPLSLVLSRKTVLRYQLLFRFLTHLKHIEQNLSQMWIDQKAHVWKVSPKGSKTGSPSWHSDLEKWRRRVWVLRARMLTVVQQIISYVTMEVLEPNWRNLEAKLGKVTTVDQLLRDHVDFLDTCLKECMLTNAKILKIHSKLFYTCLTFSQYSTQFTKQVAQMIETYEETGEPDPEELKASMDKRWAFLGKFEQNFNHHNKMHHGQVQYLATSETTALLALVVRLNSARTD